MLWRNQVIAAAFAAVFLVSDTPISQAEQLNAGAILNNMSAVERFTYLSGVIEGLAHARFVADGGATGRACLHAWFYDTPESRRKLEAAFARYPNEYAAPIILALTKRQCGGS